jgi:hypothetical protein
VLRRDHIWENVQAPSLPAPRRGRLKYLSSEWVLDPMTRMETPPTPGSGVREGGDASMSFHRGGSFDSTTSGARDLMYPDFRDSRSQFLGARPARPLVL